MRKVFLSVMLLAPLNLEDPTYYTSDDFVLSDSKYNFAVPYLIEDNVKNGDTVTIITAVEQGNAEKKNNAETNYEIYVDEVKKALDGKDVTLEFIQIATTKDFDSLTFNRFFKEVADLIEDNDKIFADITFGMKPYSFSMFIAIAYAAKAARNVDVDTVIYCQKYSGYTREAGKRTAEKIASDPNKSKIYDLTGLFYLNAIASTARAGQKDSLDKALGLIIDKD